MDTDVEMVRSSRRRDDAVPAEEFEEDTPSILDHPTVKRQNLLFLIAIFSCILGFAAFVATKIYTPSSMPSLGQLGAGGVEEDNKLNKISNVGDAYSGAHGKGWAKNHPQKNDTNSSGNHDPKNDVNNPSLTDTSATSAPQPPELDNVQKWLDAKVTLDDGIQYEVLEQINHDAMAFTEGLCFVNGRLFESVGLTGSSDLRELDPDTGNVLASYPRPGVFGEGLAYVDGKLIQLTYKKKKGFIYNLDNLNEPPAELPFDSTTHEGWGLTYNPVTHELIESDGSEYLHFWNPDTLEFIRKTPVTRLDGSPAHYINELELWRGKVLANVWYKDYILVIDPDTGMVEKEYDFSQLWLQDARAFEGADVLNGISVSADPDVLYFTGKLWDRMFKIKLLP